MVIYVIIIAANLNVCGTNGHYRGYTDTRNANEVELFLKSPVQLLTKNSRSDIVV